MTGKTVIVLMSLTAILGCESDELPPQAGQEVLRTIPVFQIDTTFRVSAELTAMNTPVSVLPDGAIALGGGLNDETAPLQILKPDGKVQSLGRVGRGPEELQSVADLFASGERIYAYDMSTLKLVSFSLDGTEPTEHQFQGAVFPVRVIGDSIDVLLFSSRGRLEFRRVAFGASGGRSVLDDRDSVFLTQFVMPFEQKRSRQPSYPARATNMERLAIGDPIQYRIYEYDALTSRLVSSFGRDLPSNRRSESTIGREIESLKQYRGPNGNPLSSAELETQEKQIRDETLPYFGSRKGLSYDHAGRLWVLGAAGDSVAIDVFADSSFLGRVTLPCIDFAGSWGANESRAAFVCLGTDGPVLKIFSIID